MIRKLYDITGDTGIAQVVRSLLSNRSFKVSLGNDTSRWRKQRNGLPQGSVLAPMLFNIYTNDQPIPEKTRAFIYADDRGIATQQQTFKECENVLESALEEMTEYYQSNSLKANPSKTQACAFHLRNHEAKRELNITWNGQTIEHCHQPKYLGVTLDRTLSYRFHIEKTKAKTETRNNILQKLATTQWGANAKTLRTTSLALCFSTAEYACSTWGRSSHAKKLDPALNNACRIITGCIKPTKTEMLYSISGIAPPAIRRATQAKKERCIQLTDERHPLHHHQPVQPRLKSRQSFANATSPLKEDLRTIRLKKWRETNPDAKEELAQGHHLDRKHWVTLNRLRTSAGKSRASLAKWGYSDDPNCDCGESQTMNHLLECRLAPTCDHNDLWSLTDAGLDSVTYWAGRV